jgi:hypothetical protein
MWSCLPHLRTLRLDCSKGLGHWEREVGHAGLSVSHERCITQSWYVAPAMPQLEARCRTEGLALIISCHRVSSIQAHIHRQASGHHVMLFRPLTITLQFYLS